MRQSAFLRSVLGSLRQHGWQMAEVDNGHDEIKTPTIRDVMREARAVDSLYVIVKRGLATGWIFVVWQGPDEDKTIDGAEIVSDYTVNLNSIIEPLYKEQPK